MDNKNASYFTHYKKQPTINESMTQATFILSDLGMVLSSLITFLHKQK